MTLTVPRAGVSGGRASRAAVATPGGTGAEQLAQAVRNFGGAVQTIGAGIEHDRLKRQSQEAQLDITRELNAARLEFEQKADPDRIDAEWAPRARSIIEQRLDGVDKSQRRDLMVAASGLADRHAYALGQRAIKLRHSQREATWLNSRAEIINSGPAMDRPTRDHLQQTGFDQIEALVEAGTISPEEGARRKLALQADLDETTAIRAATDDPARFLQMVEDGEFTGLPRDQLERMRGSALRSIDQARERSEKERSRFVASELQRISAIGDPSRLTQGDRAFLNGPEAQGHPDYAQAAAAVQLAEEAPGWRTMPPAQLRELRAAEKARPVTASWQEERLELLERQIEAHDRAMVEDPVEHLSEMGVRVAALPDFDPQNPEPFVAALSARRDDLVTAEGDGWPLADRLLSNDERSALNAAAAVSADPTARLALVSSAVAGLGDDAALFVRQLTGGDRTLEHVAGLVSSGAPRETAFDILAGARALHDKTVTVPSRAEFVEAFRRQTDDLFAQYPEYQVALLEAAQALYAARSNVPGSLSSGADIDTDLMKQSVQLAMGAVSLPRGRGQIGGAVDLRGALVPLPVGVSSGELERALDDVSGDLLMRSKDGDGSSAPDLSRLAAAAIDGSPPDFGSPPRDRALFTGDDTSLRDLFEDYEIEELWIDGKPQDVYYLRRLRNGRWVALPNADGGIYRFSARRLIEATR